LFWTNQACSLLGRRFGVDVMDNVDFVD
jgi:hypothetical protein